MQRPLQRGPSANHEPSDKSYECGYSIRGVGAIAIPNGAEVLALGKGLKTEIAQGTMIALGIAYERHEK